jgi:phthalate 4,5-dioxygenase
MNARENELLTRTGPDSPMGQLLRRYWIPALFSSQLPEPDGAPVRVKLMGEELVAIRATDGSVGVLQERCPHRRASLYFGRNEEQSLRCVYHGWRFALDGTCLETPGEPNETFKTKIRLGSYPTHEQGGIVWTYMGPRELQPEKPQLEWSLVPESHRFVSKRIQESNWFQALEGGYDYQHVGMLHRGSMTTNMTATMPKFKFTAPVTQEVIETDYGLLLGRRQEPEPGQAYWTLAQLVMPFHKVLPRQSAEQTRGAHAWVPIDDEHCMLWSIDYHPERPLRDDEVGDAHNGGGIHAATIPGTDRGVLNRDNDYGIDRAAQKRGDSFTGIPGFGTQDTAIQESQGAIYDRTEEHLCSSDKQIIALRRYFLKLLKAGDAGVTPPGLEAWSHCVKTENVTVAADLSLREVAARQ